MKLAKYFLWIQRPHNIVLLFIVLGLTILPFFWIPPGTMDLGGDNSRFYFYDPYHFLKYFTLYSVLPEGKGIFFPQHYALPYVGILVILKFLIGSPYILIGMSNALKLVGGFLSVFFITKIFLADILRGKQEKNAVTVIFLASLLAGLLYILSTGSIAIVIHWNRALLTHNQVFLNPLLFLMLLLFFRSGKFVFVASALLCTFLFAPNFSINSVASFFAFYPLAILFLVIYVIFIKREPLPVCKMLFGLLLFLGLHAFHLIPQAVSFLELKSLPNTQALTDNMSLQVNSGLQYFNAVLGLGRVSHALLLPSPLHYLQWVSVIPLLIMLCATLTLKKRSPVYTLTAVFFIASVFLASANITDTGVALYRKFFSIPGFSMFRNFYERFAYLEVFFFSLLFGQSLGLLFYQMKKKYIVLTVSLITISLFIGSYGFLRGDLVNQIHWGARGVKGAFIIDPRYEEVLSMVRSLPSDGKILTLPLTDSFYQVIYGTNDAAYIGLSTLSYIGGKNDFTGYQLLYPYPEEIMQFAREKKYDKLIQTISIFNIRYIYYNADPKVYEGKFPESPNGYMRSAFVKNQAEYKHLLSNLPLKLLYKNGPYHIYEVAAHVYRSELYIPETVYQGSVLTTTNPSFNSVFIEKDVCRELRNVCQYKESPDTKIQSVNKINPTEYHALLQQPKNPMPYILVFQNSYHPGWNIYNEKNQRVSQRDHFLVNGYANAWYINPNDFPGGLTSLRIQYDPQRFFIYGLAISFGSLAVLLILIGYSFFRSTKYRH